VYLQALDFKVKLNVQILFLSVKITMEVAKIIALEEGIAKTVYVNVN